MVLSSKSRSSSSKTGPSDSLQCADGRGSNKRREWFAVLAIVVIAAVIRAAALAIWPPVQLAGDEVSYASLATQWATSGKIGTIARAPGYIWFLGTIFRMPLDHLLMARIEIGRASCR